MPPDPPHGIDATISLRHVWPMPKMIRKSDLPTKTCATCGKPFTWRKKWEKVWDQVRYCSDRCRTAKRP